jgi:chromosome partitioning protein
MPLIIAFVSQKGGVGKSTLARALATVAVQRDLLTKVADLDLQQKTALAWQSKRSRNATKPAIDAAAFGSMQDAVAAAENAQLLVVDTAGNVTDGVSEASGVADLLVQPTSPSWDDLHISVLVFLAMERVGIPRQKLAFALCRVLSQDEARDARQYLSSFGYSVLESYLPEHIAYRDTMRDGRSIAETGQKELDLPVQVLIADMLRKAEANAGKKLRSGGG